MRWGTPISCIKPHYAVARCVLRGRSRRICTTIDQRVERSGDWIHKRNNNQAEHGAREIKRAGTWRLIQYRHHRRRPAAFLELFCLLYFMMRRGLLVVVKNEESESTTVVSRIVSSEQSWGANHGE